MKVKYKQMVDKLTEEVGDGEDWDYLIDVLDERLIKCEEKLIPAILISRKMMGLELAAAVGLLDNKGLSSLPNVNIGEYGEDS